MKLNNKTQTEVNAVVRHLPRALRRLPIEQIHERKTMRAGNLAKKKISPESAGTFPVTGGMFSALLVSTIVIVSALTFFPALSLGPILEHLMMISGKVF